jgi:hypothetical protein
MCQIVVTQYLTIDTLGISSIMNVDLKVAVAD